MNNGHISSENTAFYKQFGYLVAPNLLSVNEIAELKKETVAIFRGERGNVQLILDPFIDKVRKFPKRTSGVTYCNSCSRHSLKLDATSAK